MFADTALLTTILMLRNLLRDLTARRQNIEDTYQSQLWAMDWLDADQSRTFDAIDTLDLLIMQRANLDADLAVTRQQLVYAEKLRDACTTQPRELLYTQRELRELELADTLDMYLDMHRDMLAYMTDPSGTTEHPDFTPADLRDIRQELHYYAENIDHIPAWA